jgi:hypothetical protein
MAAITSLGWVRASRETSWAASRPDRYGKIERIASRILPKPPIAGADS